MAPVFMGAAALGLVAVAAVELAALLAEPTAEPTELVYDAISEVSESRAEPVAVASTDEYDDRRSLASLVTDLICELASDVMDDSTELECDATELPLESSELSDDDRLDRSEVGIMPLVVVVTSVAATVVVWAEARAAAKPTRMAAQRILDLGYERLGRWKARER